MNEYSHLAVKLKEIDRELTMVEGAISCGLMRQRAAELRQRNYPTKLLLHGGANALVVRTPLSGGFVAARTPSRLA